MKYRDWLFVAFILTAVVGLFALWEIDNHAKRSAAESSMTGIKAALTPFERDRRKAMEKLDRIYGGGK